MVDARKSDMEHGRFEYQQIAKAIKFIIDNESLQPSLEEVAQHVHLSPFYFQRMFTTWAGVSPKKFLQYLTMVHAKKRFAGNAGISLASAAEGLGLSGTGRLHDLFVKLEGMTPGEYKNQGSGLTISYSLNEGIFGKYLVGSTEKGVCNLHFYESDTEVLQDLKGLWPRAILREGTDENHQKIHRMFEGSNINTGTIPLHLKGTPFQLKVWEALLKIPSGSLSTYGEVAGNINHSKASRAVGSAIGANPVGYLIPCHRVIKSLGGIGEFRWGSIRKQVMIGWEAHQQNDPQVISKTDAANLPRPGMPGEPY